MSEYPVRATKPRVLINLMITDHQRNAVPEGSPEAAAIIAAVGRQVVPNWDEQIAIVRQQIATPHAIRPVYTITCRMCGNEFKTVSGRQRYCKPCQPLHEREREREHDRQRRIRQQEKGRNDESTDVRPA